MLEIKWTEKGAQQTAIFIQHDSGTEQNSVWICTEFTKPREQRGAGKHFLRKGQIEIKTNTEHLLKRQTTVLQ